VVEGQPGTQPLPIINCNVCKGPECGIKFVLIALLSQNFVYSNTAKWYIILVTVKCTAQRNNQLIISCLYWVK